MELRIVFFSEFQQYLINHVNANNAQDNKKRSAISGELKVNNLPGKLLLKL